jgi:hypothetical protein
MGKQWVALAAIGSLLGSEAVGEIDKRRPYWMTSPYHSHMEIPEGVASGCSRPIVDSGATATATGAMNLLRSLGVLFPIVGPDI